MKDWSEFCGRVNLKPKKIKLNYSEKFIILERFSKLTANDLKYLIISVVCAGLGAIALYPITNSFIAAGSFAYLLLLAGLIQIKKPALHWRLMSSAMILDLVLVLVIEVSRSAIASVVNFELQPIQQVHVYSSTLALIFYIPVAFFGRRLLRGQSHAGEKRRHKIFGILAFILRSIGFILMFSMMK